MLFKEWQPLIPVGESFVLDEFAKEDVAPDGAQSESDRIKNQPEDDVFCRYFGPVFLLLTDGVSISQIYCHVDLRPARNDIKFAIYRIYA